MKSKLIKNVLLGFTTVCAVAGFVPNASAAAPTGTCGLIASIPHPEWDWAAYMVGPYAAVPITKNMDLLAEINFTAKTIYYSITQFVWAGSGSITKTTIAGNATFILAGPGVNTTNTTPNAYQITFNPTPNNINNQVVLNVLPVNSGNTYLIQGIGDRISGVCQMF